MERTSRLLVQSLDKTANFGNYEAIEGLVIVFIVKFYNLLWSLRGLHILSSYSAPVALKDKIKTTREVEINDNVNDGSTNPMCKVHTYKI